MKMNNTTIYLLRGILFALYFIAIIAAIFGTQSATPLWALLLINWITGASEDVFPINAIKAEPKTPSVSPPKPEYRVQEGGVVQVDLPLIPPPRPSAPQEPSI